MDRAFRIADAHRLAALLDLLGSDLSHRVQRVGRHVVRDIGDPPEGVVQILEAQQLK